MSVPFALVVSDTLVEGAAWSQALPPKFAAAFDVKASARS